ncbi:MAG TPA: ATP-binding cassette domain-containing protein [Vicinamibacterales bacterium]|nr:ATP-binding cassette domain-containing protein [Vicinamibacterales bacterium]
MNAPVVRLAGIQKNYGGLRPFRLRALEVAAGERVALSGLDAATAELFVNLVTGATLPDAGTVETFGRATSEISDGDAWLASLDRFGLVSPRAVLLEGSTVQQNLALPFSLDIDEPEPDVVERVSALARECGIQADDLARPAAELPAHVRVRVHLARALALGPELLLIEHPTAEVTEVERGPLARDMAAVIGGRRASAVIITLDAPFAEAVAHRSLELQPATGALVPWKRKRGWFR